jgi:hypothetical protein
MANFYSSQHQSTTAASNKAGMSTDVAIVHSVVLSIDDIKPSISEFDKLFIEHEAGDYITQDGLYYGSIRYRKPGAANETNEDLLPVAYPLKRECFQLPVVNEIVKIYNISGKDYYEKITPENLPNFSTNPQLILVSTKQTQEGAGDGSALGNYQETSNTGIASTTGKSGGGETIKNGFAGKYFKRNLKTHQLALNEGDTILQGRFGQSIRFSGYIHDDKDNGTAFPALLIRNGESADNQKKKIYDVVSEDVNKDGTSIQITSGQYKTLYDSTTIKVTKEANSTYPSSDKLIGDQIVVNSGRVIISSKNAETFLFSKKTFSIFTDDVVTIDSEKGLNFISHNGNINIKVKANKNIFLDSSSGGNIFLGKNTGAGDAGADVQRMVLGGELVQILTQLIDAITQQSYATPVGPTATGPVNVATFNSLKNRLKNILSARNYLSKS